MPLLRRSPPSEREGPVDAAAHPGGPIPDNGEIGNHGEKEKQEAASEIGVDGKEIPHERRPEIRPDEPLARIGKQPKRQPRTAEMDQGKHRADHQRKSGDHLRAAGHRTTPPGIHEPKNRGDQRAGMTDPNPEHEVGDVETPVDGPANPGETESEIDLTEPRDEPCHDERAEKRDEHVEPPRREQQRPQQVVVDALSGRLGHTCVCLDK